VEVQEKREQKVVLYQTNQGFNYHVIMLQLATFVVVVVVIPFF